MLGSYSGVKRNNEGEKDKQKMIDRLIDRKEGTAIDMNNMKRCQQIDK